MNNTLEQWAQDKQREIQRTDSRDIGSGSASGKGGYGYGRGWGYGSDSRGGYGYALGDGYGYGMALNGYCNQVGRLT